MNDSCNPLDKYRADFMDLFVGPTAPARFLNMSLDKLLCHAWIQNFFSGGPTLTTFFFS